MHWLSALGVFIMACVVAHAFPCPMQPTPNCALQPTGPVKGQLNIFSTKEALVIGLGNYENLSKVKTAVRDAQVWGMAWDMRRGCQERRISRRDGAKAWAQGLGSFPLIWPFVFAKLPCRAAT